VSIAFATSNLAIFVKEPLYKSTPRRRKQEDERQRRYRDHHINYTKEKESSRRHHRHPFLHLIAIAIYL
jgi:hypothetical protein